MDQKKGVVRGICISKKRGTAKYPVESARIVPDLSLIHIYGSRQVFAEKSDESIETDICKDR